MSRSAPWLRHYAADVPRSLAPYPERTLLDELDDCVRETPERPFLLFKGRALSYAEFQQRSDRLASGLAHLGLQRGQRLALLLPNCPQFLLLTFAAWKLGAIVVPLNPLYTGDELAGPLADSGCTLAAALGPCYENLKSVQARTAVERVLLTGIHEHFPRHLRLAFRLFAERRLGLRVRLRPGDLRLADVARQSAPGPAGRAAAPHEPALILLSGGTTGAPKGVVGPHRSLLMSGLQLRAWYGAARRMGGERLLLPLPLFHSYGCAATLPFTLLSRSTLALVPNPRDLDDLLATARRVRPSLLMAVPTLLSALVEHPRLRRGGDDLRSVEVCLSGAAPLLAETRARFERVTGCRVLEGYSLTEALIAAVVQPVHAAPRPGSVGLPLPDVELRVADVDDGARTLAPGEVGEVLLRAPQVMPGYWQRADESAQVLRSYADGGGPWLHTGDLGYLDTDGFLFIVDRKKDLMKPGGLQVWPREVEEVLAAHPAVAEAGVAGVPHPQRGEQVKAWVVLRPGAKTDAEELRCFCRQRLAPYKVPAQVAFRAQLPKSLVGKVLRRALLAEDAAPTTAAGGTAPSGAGADPALNG